MRTLIPALLSLLALVHLPAAAEQESTTSQTITPSHVHQQARLLVAEVRVLRSALTADTPARDPGLQTKKSPLHVYSKSLELLEKISRTQTKLGMPPVEVGALPEVKKVTPTQVYESMQRILSELRRIKKEKGIETTVSMPEFEPGKLPSDVYEEVWRASYLMDSLAGSIDPSSVYRNAQLLLQELAVVANATGATLPQDKPELDSRARPEDANIEAFKNLYRVAAVQRRFNMPPIHVPDFPEGDISPSDVYDTTNMLRAELHRIRLHLDVPLTPANLATQKGKKPMHVLQSLALLGKQLENLQVSK